MKRWQLILGIFLVTCGVFAFIETLFNVDLWRFIGPLILIGIGLLLVLRPRMAGSDVKVEMPIFGDVRRSGAWRAQQHEFWMIVGTNNLDFTEAQFPNGEAVIRIISFVAEARITLPEDVGLRVEASSFFSEIDTLQGKQERIMGVLEYETPNYSEVEKRVRLQTIGFVSEITVKQAVI